MQLHTTYQLPHRRVRVADWFARPGAVTRLTPGLAPLTPIHEADNLRDGRTVFRLPGGMHWVAQHDPGAFVPGHSFADELVNRPLAPLLKWRHVHRFDDSDPAEGSTVGDSAGTVLTDDITARFPLAALAPLLEFRHATLAGDLAAADRLAGYLGNGSAVGARVGTDTGVSDTGVEPGERLPARVIAVTGSTGTVGTALCALLATAGHTVIRLVRGHAGSNFAASSRSGHRLWDPANPDPDILTGVDALVHLAGAPIFGRFTDRHLARIRDSRVGPTARLAAAVATAGTPVVVGASAVGYYGADRGRDLLDEAAPAGHGPLADIVAAWESAWEPARQAGSRVTLVRTGLVQSGGGGLLPLLAGVTWTGLGGRLGSGRQWFPWIALDDLLDIYHRAILDPTLAGPVNACAPGGVDNAAYTRTLARVLRRPALIPIPRVAPAAVLGGVGADELALASQHAVPAALDAAGHVFRFPELDAALRHELVRGGARPDGTRRQ